MEGAWRELFPHTQTHPYLNVKFVVDGQGRVLQGFDDRCVGVRKLGVFAHECNGTCFK